jgi:hypothetical protein
MRAVQPPPDADDDPGPDGKGRVIDLPAGALSSGRPRPRSGRPARAARPVTAADLGAALSASLADVTAAAERLADSGGVVSPAPPRPRRSAEARPSPAGTAAPRAPERRARPVPRPPAWQPVPWAEASAPPARPGRSTSPERSPRPPATPPAGRAAAPVPSPTAIATVPFPASHAPDAEPVARLRDLDRSGPGAADAEPLRTVPGWALAVMVVIVAVIACLAGYLLLRP